MSPERFNEMLDECFEKIQQVLGSKAEEYAVGTDRLHNFIQAAKFKGETPAQALWGFEVKHLISVNDMVKSGDYYSLEKWDEKIFDSINYLLLLRAIIIDEIPTKEASYNNFAGRNDVMPCSTEQEHFDGDGCCDSTEARSDFKPSEFPVDEVATAVSQAFVQALRVSPPIVHVHNH